VNLLRRFVRRRLERRVEKSWEPFRFPEVFRRPESVTVFCGSDAAACWPGVYLACSLQKHYRDSGIHLVLHESMADLVSTLPWEPSVHTYSSDPGQLSSPVPGGTLLFSASPDPPGLPEAVLSVAPALAAAPEGCESANVRLRLRAERYPDIVYGMCDALGIPPDRKWRPTVPPRLSEEAARILAPVSNRTLPYILGTAQAAGILEARRAELPLRLVLVDGKGRDLPEDTPEGVLMAVVAGASAVVTDRDRIWVHAAALGIPVVGYDRRSCFQPWGKTPSRGETGLVEDWAELLRRGW
jgi:hypothetical protein